MPDYTAVNLGEVEDLAPKHGITGLESRFARQALGLEKSGMTLFRLSPDFRVPFGHRHGEQEEVYVVLSGSARMKLEDEIVELGPLDAVRVPGHVGRGMEAGPAGAEILAFGAPNTDNRDAEMIQGFWEEEAQA
jgi:quercetin dioxygenase-like cupin family protein